MMVKKENTFHILPRHKPTDQQNIKIQYNTIEYTNWIYQLHPIANRMKCVSSHVLVNLSDQKILYLTAVQSWGSGSFGTVPIRMATGKPWPHRDHNCDMMTFAWLSSPRNATPLRTMKISYPAVMIYDERLREQRRHWPNWHTPPSYHQYSLKNGPVLGWWTNPVMVSVRIDHVVRRRKVWKRPPSNVLIWLVIIPIQPL